MVLALSTAFALGAAELIVRRVRPQVPLGEFDQRYEVDGRLSAIPCYFANDRVLPFALRNNFHHTVADRFGAPLPVQIDTDSHGYRNGEETFAKAKVVLVGDSVVFGFGATESSTLTATLSDALREPVYNLGIPGADPAGYAVMLRRYLQQAHPRVIIIGYYRGNDAYELGLDWWDELRRCDAPATKISRTTFVPYAPVYPTWVANSFLKNSHLATAVVSSLTLPRAEMQDDDVVRVHELLSKNAASALDNLRPTREARLTTEKTALEYANSLMASRCITPAERALLQRYVEAITTHKRDVALEIAAQVNALLVASGCNPIDRKSLVNATTAFQLWSVVQPHFLGHASAGDLDVYRDLLAKLVERPSFKSLRSDIEPLRRELEMRTPTAAADIRKFHAKLIALHPLPKRPAQCDVLDLIVREFVRLAGDAHAKLVILDIPAEHQLRYMTDTATARPSDICSHAARRGVPCLDLLPRFLDYYAHSDESLYVDMAHFNERGSSRFAEWVAPWLRAQEGH